MNDIKNIGNLGYQDDWKASADENDTWNLSVTYISENYPAFVYGEACPIRGFEKMTLVGYTVNPNLNLYFTTLNYQKPGRGDADPDDPENPDDPETPGESTNQMQARNTWSFSRGLVTQPIYDHKNFKELFKDETIKAAYEAIMSGRVDIEALSVGQQLKRKDPRDKQFPKTSYNQNLANIFNKLIFRGITDYYAPVASYDTTSINGSSVNSSSLNTLIQASGGSFRLMSSNRSTSGSREVNESYSQVLDKGIIWLEN